MDLTQRLKDLYEYDHHAIERSEAKLQRVYEGLPDKIKRVVELSGIPEELVIRWCVQASHQYNDLGWSDILDVLCSFYLAQHRWNREQQKEQETQHE